MKEAIDANSPSQKLLAAFFYGFSSFLAVIVNKIVLTNYNFPSFRFLAFSQFIATISCLTLLSHIGVIQLQKLTKESLSFILPLSIIFFLNVTTGLSGNSLPIDPNLPIYAGTKSISLPMFTALRRFSILFTMLGEIWFLQTRPSKMVISSVLLMIAGALIAAAYDLSFDSMAYVTVFANNVFTAGAGLYIKLATSKANKLTILYYQSLISAVLLLSLEVAVDGVTIVTKILEFPHWNDLMFLSFFSLSATIGLLLNYSTFLCTSLNSALTTTVVGCIKNTVSTYLGMLTFVGGDYHYNVPNFVGLNVSAIAGLLYSIVTMRA